MKNEIKILALGALILALLSGNGQLLAQEKKGGSVTIASSGSLAFGNGVSASAPELLPLAAISPAMEEQICTPDCFDDHWTGPLTAGIYTLSNGCQIVVTYWYRMACNTWFDTQITGIHALNPLCNNLSYNQMLSEAEILLMQENPMNFPPRDKGECSLNWRAVKASCWHLDPKDPQYLTGCAGSYCCLTAYKVCLTAEGRTVTKTGTGSVSGSCGVSTTEPCQFVCPPN